MNVFKRKTLSGILAGFNKTMAELDAFTSAADKRTEEIRKQREELSREQNQLNRERTTANTVKENLQKLVGEA